MQGLLTLVASGNVRQPLRGLKNANSKECYRSFRDQHDKIAYSKSSQTHIVVVYATKGAPWPNGWWSTSLLQAEIVAYIGGLTDLRHIPWTQGPADDDGSVAGLVHK